MVDNMKITIGFEINTHKVMRKYAKMRFKDYESYAIEITDFLIENGYRIIKSTLEESEVGD